MLGKLGNTTQFLGPKIDLTLKTSITKYYLNVERREEILTFMVLIKWKL